MTTTYFSDAQPINTTAAQLWTGRVLSGIAVLFLTMDAVMHILRPAPVIQGTAKVGFPIGALLPLGIIELISIAAYLIPRTRIFGAILWTGYLGGAVATHVRVGDPLFSHILAPVYVAIVLWAGLCLRDARLRAIIKGAK